MVRLVSVIETALPVFLALAMGTLCRKTGFLSREGVDALKKVVINLTLPAVLINAFASAEYSLSTLTIPVFVFLTCCLALGLGFLTVRLSNTRGRLSAFLASGFEAGMLGYALFALLFRDKSISEFAILDLGQTLFVFTLYKFLLTGKTSWRAIGKDMLTSPILWSVAVGVLLGVTGLYTQMDAWGIRGVLDSATSFISAPTAMIILLSVGYDLVPREIPWKKTGKLILMRLVVMAIILGVMVLINRTLLGSVMFEGAALLMVILPPPYVIPVFADEPEERVQISSALSALTMVTILLFAVLSVFMSG